MRNVILFLLTLMVPSSALADISLGILAPQGQEAAEERWTEFANLLSDELGEEVTVVYSGAVAGTESFLNGEIDMLIGNPVQAAVAIDQMGATPMASVVSTRGRLFAGVIAVRSDSGIANLEDLSGKRIATLGDWAAGGYLFQAQHILDAGIGNINTVAKRMQGNNQRELVQMVLDGTADAAFIRTGVLEQLIANGSIGEGDLMVLDAQGGSTPRSTKWYPEWFAVAQGTMDADRAERITNLLSGFDGSHPAMQRAGVAEFIDPLSVDGVVAAMRNLEVSPYN